MTVTLADKIAAVEGELELHQRYQCFWETTGERDRHIAALQAVLADLRAQEDHKLNIGALVQRVLRVLDHDRSMLTQRELAEAIVEGIRDLLDHQIGHPQRIAEARRAGAEAMRERAAKVPPHIKHDVIGARDGSSIASALDLCERAIRALPVE